MKYPCRGESGANALDLGLRQFQQGRAHHGSRQAPEDHLRLLHAVVLVQARQLYTKAQRELGWQHPAPDAMWDAIVRGERALMAQRRGFLNRLRQQAVVPD
jgi:hypothetical protein